MGRGKSQRAPPLVQKLQLTKGCWVRGELLQKPEPPNCCAVPGGWTWKHIYTGNSKSDSAGCSYILQICTDTHMFMCLCVVVCVLLLDLSQCNARFLCVMSKKLRLTHQEGEKWIPFLLIQNNNYKLNKTKQTNSNLKGNKTYFILVPNRSSNVLKKDLLYTKFHIWT